MKKSPEEILKKVRRIEISTRRTVDTMLSGQYHTRFKGQGMQFSDFREYYAGDDIRHIDWKVTARTQSAHIRKFEEERDLTVYLLVDLSLSESFGSEDKLKSDALTEVCALIAFTAIHNNDKVGLIIFTDQVEKHIPPRKGRGHALRLVTELLHFEPKHKKTNIKLALDEFYSARKNTAVVFLASDFLDQDFLPSLRKVGKKHDLIALRMLDPREKEIPRIGYLELEDAEGAETFGLSTATSSFQYNYKKNFEEFEVLLEQGFKQAGIDCLKLWTNEDYFLKVVSFFRSRKSSRR